MAKKVILKSEEFSDVAEKTATTDQKKEKKATETKSTGSITRKSATYSRADIRKARIFRIVKVPKTTSTYRIQSVDEKHNITWKDVSLVEARKAAVSSVINVPLLRILNRIRLRTIPSISSLKSPRQKVSPPWSVTNRTAQLFNSLKKLSHSSLGRS